MRARAFWYTLIAVGAAGLIVLIVLSYIRQGQQLTKANETLQAVRDTQTEGSPLLKAIADQQDQIQQAADAAVATNTQLADCLTPGGVCFRDQRQRQAAFLQLVGAYSACAIGYVDLPDTQRIEATNTCVAKWSETAFP